MFYLSILIFMLQRHFFFIILLFNTAFVTANSYEFPDVVISKTTTAPIIDGVPNDECWDKSITFDYFVLQPVWGANPTEKTQMKLLYDDKNLYVAGFCYTKKPETIVARNLMRDGWRGDDWVSFHVDSRFDKQNVLVFSVYPTGARFDMAIGNDAVPMGNSTFNIAYNMHWDAKVSVNKEGWFFEMKIPLFNLRFRPNANGLAVMGISSSRQIMSCQELQHFPQVPQNEMHATDKASLKMPVRFDSIAKPELFLLTPYVKAANYRAFKYDINTGFAPYTQLKPEIGADAKLAINTNLTLDISINPDFSQVEADEQMVNLTRFSLFFPEQRLFFQEQAGLFEFNLGGSQLFYSRRIGLYDSKVQSLYGGMRITGKIDSKTDIGWLNMQSVKQIELADTMNSENFGVLRLRRKIINDKSYMGAMFVNRNSPDNQHYSLGFDAAVNPFRNHYFNMAIATTYNHSAHNTRPKVIDATRIALQWENRRTDKWSHNIGYNYSGQFFQPEVGFVNRGNMHNFWGYLNYGKHASTQSKHFQYISYTPLFAETYHNVNNTMLESARLSTTLDLRTMASNRLTFHGAYEYEHLEQQLAINSLLQIKKGIYHNYFYEMAYQPAISKSMRLPITLSEGQFFEGRRFDLSFQPVFSFGKNFELSGGYSLNYLRFKQHNLYLPIHIMRLKLSYALNLKLSVIYMGQYNSNVKQVFNNLRIRYNFADGHDLYAVWNENYFTKLQNGRNVLSDQQHFILKYNYTFNLRK